MLKPEVIHSLKKVNISKNAEKTKARVREVWAPLRRDVRNEILELAAIKRVSIERAYKTGGASARVLVAMAQVLDIDPRWLTGEVDQKGTFDGEVVRKYLNGLGYDVGKHAVGRTRKATKAAPEPVADAPVRKKPGPKPGFKAASAQKSAPADAASPPDMYGITRELAKLLSSDVRAKLNKVSDDDVLLLFRSLSVQATFNEEKQSRLALIKCLLLV